MNNIGAISQLPVFGAGDIKAQAPPDDKEDFLKLLVAQMRYQDPLSPLQGTEFAAQLAQFSSVEELRNIGGKMDQQTEGNLMLARSVNNTLATTLIGKQVRAEDDRLTFDGDHNVNIRFNLSGLAAPVRIEIMGDNGSTIRTIELPNAGEGDQTVVWDGRDARGNRVPLGDYQVKITATGTGGGNVVATPLAIGRIEGVRFVDGNPVLLMGGRTIPFGSVIEILDSANDGSLLDRLMQAGN